MKRSSGARVAAPKPPARAAHPPRTMGPVSDLEQHLPPDWWAQIFNATYLKTDGDVVENLANTRAECDLLIAVGELEPGHRILDVCCGQGRHLLELARRGFEHLTGIDRSRYLIRVARRRAREQDLPVRFHEGDARKLRGGRSAYDRVTLLGNSFGYFDRAEDDLEVLRSVRSILAPGGRIVLDVTDGEWVRRHFEPRSWEWIDQQQFVCRERALSADGHRLIAREVVVHAEKGVLVDQFYAERLYSAEELTALLEAAGFEQSSLHPVDRPRSERNQDLGMMAHRILLTAARAGTDVAALTLPAERSVTVLLGDPRRPDAVKRTGAFSVEDHVTVERLEAALAELDEFEFSFVDDHSALVRKIAEERPKFVLNLCDEGFANDPFLELHVPALLELFGVPYSGAGPSCLGLCYDKAIVRAVAESLSIPVPVETYMRSGDSLATTPSPFPVLVKPNHGDSSQGITEESVVHDPGALVERVRRLGEQLPGRPVLVQEFLTGKEYTVGVVGNPGLPFTALPVLEVDYSALDPSHPPILGYESKWHPDSPYWKDIRYVQAELSESERTRIVESSLILFERLACRDYARFDFRADGDGVIKLLEVNPNPGWCWDGKLAMMAELAGWSYPELLRRILSAAQRRLVAAGRL